MATLVVACCNSGNFCLPVLHGEHTRINRIGFLGLANDQYLNSFRSGVWHEPIQLINKLEFCRNALCDRVSGIHYKIFDVLELLVALAPAAYIIQVVRWPIGPVVPYRRM